MGNDEDPMVLSAKLTVSGRGRVGDGDDDFCFESLCVVVGGDETITARGRFCDSRNLTFPSMMVSRAPMVRN